MPSVLVFENDSAFAAELTRELEKLGCAVTVTDDASVGLRRASTDKPDLILLTIELPRMNGFSICNQLKRNSALKSIPLIIMSSGSTEETFEQHRKLRTHAEDYFHKPVALTDLLTRITAHLAGANAGDQGEPTDEAKRVDVYGSFTSGADRAGSGSARRGRFSLGTALLLVALVLGLIVWFRHAAG